MAALGARMDRKKKMKGKKKVKNLLEKKAKGLKLNQVDRRRLLKLEEKMKFKSELNESVKAEMSKLRLSEKEDVDETINVDPSSPSAPSKKPKDKRVSFSGNMERVKVFDKNVKDLEIKPSSASPGKGILRVKPKKAALKKKKKRSKFLIRLILLHLLQQQWITMKRKKMFKKILVLQRTLSNLRRRLRYR
ncbi:hypothetical protein OSTOST_06049 [Ostertagia ostertagi]